MKMKQLFFDITMAIIFICVCGILLITYWMIAPYNILTFQEQNTDLLQTTVRSGSYLGVKENYCKNKNMEAVVSRIFIDSVVYQIPVFTSNRETGCNERIEYVYIPKALPLGEYKIITVYSYKVNPIRTINYTLETDFFTVTEASASAR